MDEIRTMLNKVASGELSVEDAVLELKKEPFTQAGFDDLGFAKLDTHRKLRQKDGGTDCRNRGSHEKKRAGSDFNHPPGQGKG